MPGAELLHHFFHPTDRNETLSFSIMEFWIIMANFKPVSPLKMNKNWLAMLWGQAQLDS